MVKCGYFVLVFIVDDFLQHAVLAGVREKKNQYLIQKYLVTLTTCLSTLFIQRLLNDCL